MENVNILNYENESANHPDRRVDGMPCSIASHLAPTSRVEVFLDICTKEAGYSNKIKNLLIYPPQIYKPAIFNTVKRNGGHDPQYYCTWSKPSLKSE